MAEEIAGLVVNIQANAQNALTQLKDVQERLEFIRSKRYSVNVNAQESLGKVEKLITSLRELKRSAKISIDVTDSGATSRIAQLNTALANMSKRKAEYNFKFATNADTVAERIERLSLSLQDVATASRKLQFTTNASEVGAQVKDLRSEVQMLRAAIQGPIRISGGSMAADFNEATKGARRASSALREFQNTTRATKSMWATFRDSLTIFGTGYLAISAMTRVLGFFKSSLIDFNDTLQQAQIGFSTILGDAGKAAHLVQVVKQFAIDTPFSMQGVMPDVQKLLSFGVIDKNLPINELSKQVIEAMTAIGDASYALGRGQEGISRMLLAFGQMHTATKANAQDLRQLKEVGVDAWRYLAEGTGKTTAEVRELVSKGLIPAEAAIRAILKGMSRDFGGGMARAATESITGATEVLLDTLQAKIAAAYDTVNKHFTGVITQMADALDEKNFTDWADRAAAAVEGTLMRALDKGSAAVRTFSDVITKNRGIVEGFLLMLIARSITLMTLGGNGAGLAALAIAFGLLADGSSRIGQMAKAATPVLWGLAAAMYALNTAQAISIGVINLSNSLSTFRTVAAATTAAVNVLRTAVVGLFTTSSIAMFTKEFIAISAPNRWVMLAVLVNNLKAALLGSAGAAAGFAAAIGAVGIAALVGMTMWQKYQEKLALVRAAQAEFNYVAGLTKGVLGDLEKYSGGDPKVLEKVKELTAEYQKLHTSIAGIQELQSKIGALRNEVKVSAKFDDVDRRVINDVLNQYQAMLDEENNKLKLKAQLEVDANPMSGKNLQEALEQQYGKPTLDYIAKLNVRMAKVFTGYAYFEGIFAAVKMGASLLYQVWQAFWAWLRGAARTAGNWLSNAFINATGGVDGWGARVLQVFDVIGRAINWLRSRIANLWQEIRDTATNAWKWATGQSADNQGYVPGIGDPIPRLGGSKMPSDFMVSHKSDRDIANQRANARAVRDSAIPKIPILDGDGAGGKAGRGAAKREAADNRAAQAAARLKKQLEESARAYDELAKAAEASGKRQVDALQGVVNSIRGLFETVQKKLIDAGVINNPLGNIIAQFQKNMGIDAQVAEIGARYGAQIAGYEGKANALRSRAETVGVVSGDKFGTSLANEMAASVHRSVGIKMACARFVSNWIKQLGIAVKTSDSARQLRANVIASGARRIPVSQARAGDALFMRSGSAPSGYHAGIGAGGGMFAAKNRDRYGKISTYGWQEAYATSELAGGGKPIYAPGGEMGAAGSQSVVERFRQAIRDFNGAFSLMKAVPKGWGKPLTSEDDGMFRFEVQKWLATPDGQAALKSLIGKEVVTTSLTKDKGVRFKVGSADDAAAYFRDMANKVDILLDKSLYPQRIRAIAKETASYNKVQADSIQLSRTAANLMSVNNKSLQHFARDMALATEAQKIWNDVNKDPKLTPERRQVEFDSRMRAFTKRYDAEQDEKQLDKYLSIMEDLDKAYKALGDTTAEATLRRKIWNDATYESLTLSGKEEALLKELRNLRRQTSNEMQASATKDNEQQWLDFVNKGASAAEQLANKYEQALLDIQKNLPGFQPTAETLEKQRQSIEILGWIEQYDDLSEAIKKVVEDVKKLNGTASAEQISDMGFAANELNDKLAALTGVAPLTTKQIEGFKKQIKEAREEVAALTLAITPFDKEMARLRKQHLRAMKGTGLEQELFDYRETLDNFKDENTGKVYTEAEKDRAVNQLRRFRIEEERTKYQQDLASRLLERSALTDFSAQAARLKKEFTDNGFSPEEISQFLGKEKWIYAFDQLKGIFANAFDSIYTEGFGGFFDNVLNGISKMLNDIATQILTSYVTNMIMGLVGGSMGGGFGAAMGMGGVMALPGFATGLPNVPFDNFPARLHKGEAVLTAREAEMWRNMTSGITSGGGSGQQGQGMAGTVVNNYYNIGSVQANNPQQFVKRMDNSRKSRTQTKRDALLYVSGGQESI